GRGDFRAIRLKSALSFASRCTFWRVTQRAEQCIGFHMLLLAELRIPDRTGNSPRGKRIYRQSWKRWKMQFIVGCRTKGSCMLEADQKFEAIFGSDMRPLFAILGLLLCWIAPRSHG